MDSTVLDMVFGAISAVIQVLKTLTFGGVPLFYIIIGFLILSAVITYVINTARSPYVDSERQSQSAVRRRRKGE